MFVIDFGISKPRAKEFLLKKQKGKCFYCRRILTFSGWRMNTDFCFEHLTPIKRGGKDSRDNVVGSCIECNKKKMDRTFMEYLEYMKKKNGSAPSHLTGRLGGMKTKKIYGLKHFKKIATRKK